MGHGDQLLAGRAYLEAATRLLQRSRCADATAGIWEAADLQWWWRRPRPSDHLWQPFVLDDAGAPLAAVVLTDWGDRWACDPVAMPDRAADLLPGLWAAAVDQLNGSATDEIETSVRDDDPLAARLAADTGFRPTDARYAETWLDAREVAVPTAAPAGYVLSDRTGDAALPHHLAVRNGPEVAVRLAETSLYRPDLDLCLRTTAGEVAAYGLFWLDPVTGVGLVEPMRTEADHQGRGLAAHVLGHGLARLARLGATRLKVSHELDNPAAAALYRSAGFRPRSTSTVHTRDARPATRHEPSS